MKNLSVQQRLIGFIREYGDSQSLYWFPLVNVKKDIPVAAFDMNKIYNNSDVGLLEKVFKCCKISDVNTFQMDNLEYFEGDNIISLLNEKDENGYCFPSYVETFYFDNSESWIVYVSHEGTISFTGEIIVKAAIRNIQKKYLIN